MADQTGNGNSGTYYGESVHQTGTNGGTPLTAGPPTNLGVLQPYKQAADTAKQAKSQAADEVTRLQRELAALPPTVGISTDPQENPAYRRKLTELTAALQSYDNASREHQRALDNYADASAKEAQRNDPTTQAAAKAAADAAKTQADRARAEYQEWQQAAPDRKGATVAAQRVASLQADQAQLDLDYQRETDPQRKQLLQQQIDANKASIEQAQAGANVASQTVGAQVTTATETANQATIGTKTSQANLEDLLRRIRQAPDDAQARQALEQALQQGQANLEATQAGTAATKAETEQSTLGGLAGLDQFMAAQKDAISRGVMTPDAANQALTARIMGTDVYTQQKDQLTAALNQRTQDTSLVNSARSDLTSAANSAFGTVSGQASKAHHGSGDALAGGYSAMLNDITGRFGGPSTLQSPAPVQMPQLPMLNAYSQPAQPAAAQPVGDMSAGDQVHVPLFTAAAAAPPSPLDQGVMDPRNQGGEVFRGRPMPQFVQNRMPVTAQSVIQMYPDAARRAGLL